MPHPSRILIVDDHPVFRKGLSHLINEEPDMIVCGEAEDVDAAKNAVTSLMPDMAIVDISLKDKSGIDFLSHLKETRPDLPSLVVSMHEESLYAERVLKLGAMGYIMKSEMSDNVVHAIRHVLTGRIYASDIMVSQLLGKLSRKAELTAHPVECLSHRELEVFQLIGKGLPRKEIAALLGVSAKTVGSYKELIKKKLGVATAGELMREAISWTEEGR